MKRFLSLILAFCLCVTMLPNVALQASAVSYVNYNTETPNYSTGVSTVSELVSRLNTLVTKYENTSWTSTGSPCASHGTCYSKYYYGHQCSGFAKYIFNDLFCGGSIGSTDDGDYALINLNNATLIGQRIGIGSTDGTSVKSLLSQAKPGDFIQMHRRSGKPHSMIVLSVGETGIRIFDNNSGSSRCTVQVYDQTWEAFANKNDSFSLYRSTKYPEDSGPTVADLGTNFYANIVNTNNGMLLTNDSNNVSIRSDARTNSQIWYFERLSDGSYKITSAFDGNSLDVDCAGTDDGTNLKTDPYTGHEAQQWWITGSAGSYVFSAKCANTVVDVANDASDEGTNVQMWSYNGSPAQLFSVNNVAYLGAIDVGTDFYAHISNTNHGMLLTNDLNNVSLRSDTDSLNQVWFFKRQNDNSYVITSALNGYSLDVDLAGTDDGTNLKTDPYTGHWAQQWWISGSSASYTIQSKCSFDVIDVTENLSAEGTNMQMWGYNGTSAQLFQITPLAEGAPTVAYLSADKVDYKIGEEVTFTLSSDAACDFYLSIIDADSGEYIITGEKVYSTYKNSFLKAGHYVAWMTAANSKGSKDSNVVDFWVFDSPPATASFSANKTEMALGETVTLTTSTDTYYVRIAIALFLHNESNNGTQVCSGTVPYTYNFTPQEPGRYTGYVTAYTHEGGVDSNWVTFYVGKYNVTYDANGGSGAPASQVKYYGKDLILSDTKPTRANYTFLGWASSPTASTAEYLPGGTFKGNANTTLYAVWGHVCTNGHSYSYKVSQAPTTNATGTLNGTCSKCQEMDSVILPMLNKTDYSYEVIQAATCSGDDLIERYTWNNTAYGIYYFDVISDLHLTHNYLPELVAPTCTEAGYTTYTCRGCGDSYVSDYVDALGHDYKSVVTAPTCTEDGYTTHTCSRCDDSYTDTPVAALGHDWDEGVVTVEPTEDTAGEMLYTCARCGETKTEVIPELGHEHSYEAVVTAPTCTERGYTTYTCRCGDCYVSDYVDALGHDYKSVVTAPTCTEDGYTTHTCSRCDDSYTDTPVAALGHDYVDGICTRCGAKDPDYEEPTPGTANVIRLSGKDRYLTAFAVANRLKELMGVTRFDTVIVAYGQNFPDALTGSYLAAVKNAPILLTEPNKDALVLDYISENLTSGGKVYILGGTAAVSENFENSAKEAGFDVVRLKGKGRYETNLEILKAAGVNQTDEILIATGTNFADSLSASATKLPMLLVGPGLTAEQKAFLATTSRKFVIIGGTGAVNEAVEAELAQIGTVERIKGKTRYETSVVIAERYFTDPAAAVLAYAQGFPDGLCGGPLAMNMGAPLILTSNEAPTAADDYIEGITVGAVTGGTGRITDDTVRAIFDLAADTEIPKY